MSAHSTIYLKAANTHGSLAVKSWKDQPDQNIVKQDLDYSCRQDNQADNPDNQKPEITQDNQTPILCLT